MFIKNTTIEQKNKTINNIQKACSLAQSLRYFAGKLKNPNHRRHTSADVEKMIKSLEKTAEILKIKELDCYNQPLSEIHFRVFDVKVSQDVYFDFIFSLQEVILRYLYATDFELFKNDLKYNFNLAKERGKDFNNSIRKIIVKTINEAREEYCDMLSDAIYEIVEKLKEKSI